MIMAQEYVPSEKNYVSSDLALVTAISLWYPIEAIDWNDSNKASFMFARNVDLDQLIERFWCGKLRVEPQSYFNQMKIIKARLHSK